MGPRVTGSRELPIGREDDVVLVRRAARALAEEHGFDTFATAALTTAVSELARNAWAHAGGGTARLEELSDGERPGIRITFEDQGQGIEDVPRVLGGGFSTGASLGLGLSGSRRLVDEFSLESVVGKGTRVVITKWKRY